MCCDSATVTEKTPLMSASSRLDLNMEQDKIDENRNIENFEDGDFPALRHSCDRRAHTHHTWDISRLVFGSKMKLREPVKTSAFFRN